MLKYFKYNLIYILKNDFIINYKFNCIKQIFIMYNVHAKILVYNKMDGDSIHLFGKRTKWDKL